MGEHTSPAGAVRHHTIDLFWSKHGAVACDLHAPPYASDEWVVNGWQRVPDSRHGFHTSRLQCQFCHGGRPFVRLTVADAGDEARSPRPKRS